MEENEVTRKAIEILEQYNKGKLTGNVYKRTCPSCGETLYNANNTFRDHAIHCHLLRSDVATDM